MHSKNIGLKSPIPLIKNLPKENQILKIQMYLLIQSKIKITPLANIDIPLIAEIGINHNSSRARETNDAYGKEFGAVWKISILQKTLD